MVPSLTAVDDAGVPCAPGLLYGDERGHRRDAAAQSPRSASSRSSCAGTPRNGPTRAATGWRRPSPTTRSRARPVISTTVARDRACRSFGCERMGRRPRRGRPARGSTRCPRSRSRGSPLAEVRRLRRLRARRRHDRRDGRADRGRRRRGRRRARDPRHDADRLGGRSRTRRRFVRTTASRTPRPVALARRRAEQRRRLVPRAGSTRLLGERPAAAIRRPSDDVPLWVPYPRGERVPINDSTRRAELVDLDLTHGAAAIRRAAFEASGFVTRRMIDASPGAGAPRSSRPAAARASTDGWRRSPTPPACPVHVAAVPEGGALGAAFLARMAAGLETNMADAPRWARVDRVVDPDPAWIEPAGDALRALPRDRRIARVRACRV